MIKKLNLTVFGIFMMVASTVSAQNETLAIELIRLSTENGKQVHFDGVVVESFWNQILVIQDETDVVVCSPKSAPHRMRVSAPFDCPF